MRFAQPKSLPVATVASPTSTTSGSGRATRSSQSPRRQPIVQSVQSFRSFQSSLSVPIAIRGGAQMRREEKAGQQLLVPQSGPHAPLSRRRVLWAAEVAGSCLLMGLFLVIALFG